MTAGFPDWGGVPLVHGESLVVNANGTLNVQTAVSLPVAQFSRPGYQISVTLANIAVGGVAMPVQIDMQWQDSASGLLLGHQRWHVLAASRTNTHNIIGYGPTGGDQLTLTIFNNGSAANVLGWNVIIGQTTAAYTEHSWQTDDSNGMLLAGFTSAPSAMVAGMLCQQPALAINANQTILQVLPLYRGLCRLGGFTTSVTSDLSWNISTVAGTVNASNVVVADGFSDANGNFNFDVWLPGAQCILNLKNNNVAAKSFSTALTAARIGGGYG